MSRRSRVCSRHPFTILRAARGGGHSPLHCTQAARTSSLWVSSPESCKTPSQQKQSKAECAEGPEEGTVLAQASTGYLRRICSTIILGCFSCNVKHIPKKALQVKGRTSCQQQTLSRQSRNMCSINLYKCCMHCVI